MSKQVYIPSDDQLHQMQELGVNVYKYLLTKTVETLAMSGTIYYNKGMLKTEPKHIKEDEYISRAICEMYPQEIKYSFMAQNDIKLCLSLLEKKEDRTIYNLDNLSLFEDGLGVLTNKEVINKTIHILANKLKTNPQYRFNYQEPNKLLDDIFSTKILERLHFFDVNSNTTAFELAELEPTYALLYDTFKDEYNRKAWLNSAIDAYAEIYGVRFTKSPEFNNQNNILESQSAKRLIRCIKQNNK